MKALTFLLFAAICSGKNLNIENYLRSNHIQMVPGGVTNEGYMTRTQKNQFIRTLKDYNRKDPIRIICEIGLNGGHSAQTLINNCPKLEHFVSFDINQHFYTPFAVDYFTKELGSKFSFHEGDSLKTVPQFTKTYPDFKADLIYVDGCHLYEWALEDIINCQKLAHENSYLWVDDVDKELKNSIGQAVQECVNRGVIQIIYHHTSVDPEAGFRGWIEAKYCHTD